MTIEGVNQAYPRTTLLLGPGVPGPAQSDMHKPVDEDEAEDSKRAVIGDSITEASFSSGGQVNNLNNFRVERVLSCPASRKFAAVVGCFQDDTDSDSKKAVVTLERKAFDPQRLPDLLSQSKLDLDFSNAEYSIFNLVAADEHSGIKCDVIYPATAKHIAKYTEPDLRIIRETFQIYQEVVLPYIERDERGQRIEWVHNILDKKKEVERIIFEDTDPSNGFILLPDMKWDQGTLTDLYCLAIINRRDITSLRSLTSEHLPLLHNIFEKVRDTVEKRKE